MDQDKLFKSYLGESDITDNEVEELLNMAKMIILNRRYPFQDFPVDEDGEYVIEDRYLDLQVRIAVELYSKQGVEGQSSHTENGVTRNYFSAGVSSALLAEIIPKGKIL